MVRSQTELVQTHTYREISMTSIRFNATICSFVLGVIANINTSHGQTEFVDTFDGNAEAWTVHELSQGTWSVVDGSYVGVGGDENVGGEGAVSLVTGMVFDDVSVESTATVVGGANIGIEARVGGDGLTTGYVGSIASNRDVFISRLDGPDSQLVLLAAGHSQGFSANDEVNLRFDVVENKLSFWAWVGEEMPPTPTLTATDSLYSEGVVGLAFLEFPNEQGRAMGYVRDFRAVAVPEPTSMTLLMCGLLASLAARSRSRDSRL